MKRTLKSVSIESLAEGDTVETASEIRVDDIVVIFEQAPRAFAFKAVTPEEASAYSGPKYRAKRGTEPGTIAWELIDQE